MAEDIWKKGRLTPVYQQVGTHADSSEPRYSRAPYDVLRWTPPGGTKEEVYILPLGHELSVGGLALGGALDWQQGMEFGFYDDNRYILDPERANGGDDGWQDCHGFGHF